VLLVKVCLLTSPFGTARTAANINPSTAFMMRNGLAAGGGKVKQCRLASLLPRR
jgi:hypothetical protein